MNSKKDKKVGYAFITVPLIIIGIFVILALLFGIYMSFHKFSFLLDGTIQKEFIGLDNYKFFLSDETAAIAMRNTIKYVLMVVPFQIVGAIAIAMLINQKINFRKGFRALYFFPVLTATAALSMIFMFLFNPNGPINNALLSFGILGTPINFLNDPEYSLEIIALMGVWKSLPFSTTVILAALTDVPTNLYEAADIDGAQAWTKFWKITMPSIKPAVVFVTVTALVGTFQMFDEAFIISGGSGGPSDSTMTMSLLIYNYAFNVSYGSMGYAAALSVILGIIIFVFAIIVRRIGRSESMY